MSDKDLIEQVARSLWIGEGYSPGHWDGTTGRQWAAYMFNHKSRYYDLAQSAIAAIQADAEPVAWMYTHEDGSRFFSSIRQNQPFHDMEPRRRNGWTETPLYAHPPVDDRVSTSSPTTPRTPPTMTSEAPIVTQALEYSRMADPEAWANAESGKHSRENNIRLAQANAMGKARYLSELLAGFSQSQFVEAAASENGENLLNALVGVLSDYPNHRQSADSHHRLIEALREYKEASDA